MHYVVEEHDEGQKINKTLIMKPTSFNALNSELAVKVLTELGKKPQCAMDIARKLKEHEQKIYYHLRRLEKNGIIKLIRREERVGGLAKIYEVSHPYISIKLFDGGHLTDVKMKPKEIEFFKSFIKNGKLDGLIVVGSPDPHGKYGAHASDGSAAVDLALLLGSFLTHASPNYKLDTELKENDLKNNLILVGGPKANILIDRINTKMPVYFDTKNEFNIVSTFTKSVYSEDNVGVIVKMKNPFASDREILILSGKRFKGTKSAILGLVKYLKKLGDGNQFDGGIARVVHGIDRDADGIIDDVEFLE
ncbi:MAG: helix-turn-helix domain-containing protein [Candidatus Aenigmarchaeota archaeon]|nr:helix-turn-helix domain-containing protein [Candidatus Aenigmarchaeota archaeon]